MRFSEEEPNDQQLRERIRKWLWHYMRQHGLKQRELAAVLGLTEATMSTCLHGGSDPSLDTFVRLHFRSGFSMEQMVRSDPKVATQPHAPTQTEVGHKRSRGG